MKETIILKTLPQISFAHIFNSESKYENYLPKRYNSFEFGYIKSGGLDGQINSIKYKLNCGDVYFLPHNAEIKTYSSAGNEHHCVGITCPYEFNSESISIITINESYVHSSYIKKKIDSLVLLFNTDNQCEQKILCLIFEIIDAFNDYFFNNQTPTTTKMGEITYVKKIKDYIAKNISSEISLQTLADVLHISVPYMCTSFKKITGLTIVSYINEQKLTQMKNLISHYGFSLKEASSFVGIKDPSYASRLFKKHEKLSIREYKNSIRENI